MVRKYKKIFLNHLYLFNHSTKNIKSEYTIWTLLIDIWIKYSATFLVPFTLASINFNIKTNYIDIAIKIIFAIVSVFSVIIGIIYIISSLKYFQKFTTQKIRHTMRRVKPDDRAWRLWAMLFFILLAYLGIFFSCIVSFIIVIVIPFKIFEII